MTIILPRWEAALVRRKQERDLGLEFWLAYGVYRQALVRALVARGFTDLREIDATLLRYLHHSGGPPSPN